MIITMLLAAALTAVPGPGFSATFTPSPLATHLQGKVGYAVVGAGPATPALSEAAAAFEAALSQSGRAELILNGKSLGPVGDLDDPALVKRCAALPVARVAVVRVFEVAGDAPRAVVTVYDREVKLLTAFTGQAGIPLAPAAQAAAVPSPRPGEGVGSAAAAAVLQTAKGPAASAQEEYDREYVWFADLAAVTNHGRVLTTWTTPYQGKYHKPLEGADFYQTVGRADLAARFTERQHLRYTLLGLGVASVATGLVVGIASLSSQDNCDVNSNTFGACVDRNGSHIQTAVAAMFIGAGVGGAFGLAAALINPHPIEAPEARQLAEEHNQRLKAKLGLAASEPAAEEDASRLSLSLAPVRGGGMVGLALQF